MTCSLYLIPWFFVSALAWNSIRGLRWVGEKSWRKHEGLSPGERRKMLGWKWCFHFRQSKRVGGSFVKKWCMFQSGVDILGRFHNLQSIFCMYLFPTEGWKNFIVYKVIEEQFHNWPNKPASAILHLPFLSCYRSRVYTLCVCVLIISFANFFGQWGSISDVFALINNSKFKISEWCAA